MDPMKNVWKTNELTELRLVEADFVLKKQHINFFIKREGIKELMLTRLEFSSLREGILSCKRKAGEFAITCKGNLSKGCLGNRTQDDLIKTRNAVEFLISEFLKTYDFKMGKTIPLPQYKQKNKIIHIRNARISLRGLVICFGIDRDTCIPRTINVPLAGINTISSLKNLIKTTLHGVLSEVICRYPMPTYMGAVDTELDEFFKAFPIINGKENNMNEVMRKKYHGITYDTIYKKLKPGLTTGILKMCKDDDYHIVDAKGVTHIVPVVFSDEFGQGQRYLPDGTIVTFEKTKPETNKHLFDKTIYVSIASMVEAKLFELDCLIEHRKHLLGDCFDGAADRYKMVPRPFNTDDFVEELSNQKKEPPLKPVKNIESIPTPKEGTIVGLIKNLNDENHVVIESSLGDTFKFPAEWYRAPLTLNDIVEVDYSSGSVYAPRHAENQLQIISSYMIKIGTEYCVGTNWTKAILGNIVNYITKDESND